MADLLETEKTQFPIGQPYSSLSFPCTPKSPPFSFFHFFFLSFSSSWPITVEAPTSVGIMHALAQQHQRTPAVSLPDHKRCGATTTCGRNKLRASRPLFGQVWWLLWLISTILEWSWDSKQVDTKFAKFCRRKNWHISPCNQNFASRFEPNGASFRGNDSTFLLVVKNTLKLYILSMFSDTLKITLFEAELSIKVVSSQFGFGIKIRDHSHTSFDITNLMEILDLANELPLKVIFF